MREPETVPQGETIKVTIGRFGSTPQDFTVAKNTTVESALQTADIPYTEGNIFVNGEPATKENLLDDGDIINIVTSKEGGR